MVYFSFYDIFRLYTFSILSITKKNEILKRQKVLHNSKLTIEYHK